MVIDKQQPDPIARFEASAHLNVLTRPATTLTSDGGKSCMSLLCLLALALGRRQYMPQPN